MLTPERSMEVQALLGSDIVMAFDQLVPTTSGREVQAAAMERSMRWARRSRDAFTGEGALFGIQQGGLDEGLRKASADALREIGFDGYAVGASRGGEDAMFACRISLATTARGGAALFDGVAADDSSARERGIDISMRPPDPLRAHRPSLPKDGRSTSARQIAETKTRDPESPVAGGTCLLPHLSPTNTGAI